MKSWLLLGGLASLSCDSFLTLNPEYCDENIPCAEGLICDTHHRCVGSPIVIEVSPAFAAPDAETLITLNGAGFVEGMKLFVDNKPITATLMSPTQVQFALPATTGACGPRTAMVTLQTAEGLPVQNGQRQIPYKYTTISFAQSGNPYAVNSGASAIAAAPVFNSTTNDLLVTSTDSGAYLSVLKRNTDDSFVIGKTYSGASGFKNLIAKDLNGDGSTDLVLIADSAFEVFQGTSGANPLFESKVVHTYVSADIVVADLNRSGRKDILLLEAQSERLDVFHFDNYTYSTISNYLIGDTPGAAVVVDDFNNDNRLDAAVAVPSDRSLHVVSGDGAGGFLSLNSAISTSSFGAPTRLAVLDADLDGFKDLIFTTDSTIGGMLALATNKDGIFTLSPIADIAPNPRLMLLEDLDCDGLKDIILYHTNATQLNVYLNLGMGKFDASPKLVNLGATLSSLVIANLGSNINKPDIALLRPGSASVSAIVYRNTSR